MRHARPAGTLDTALAEPMGFDAYEPEPDSPWTWPSAPLVPAALGPTALDDLLTPVVERVPTYGDQPKHGAPTTQPRPKRAAPSGSLATGIGMALLATAIGVLVWTLAARETGYSLGVFAIALGALVGAAMRRFGGPPKDTNVFVAVVLSVLGAVAGFYATTVTHLVKTSHVGLSAALSGTQWNDITRSVGKYPLHWILALLAVTAAIRTLRR